MPSRASAPKPTLSTRDHVLDVAERLAQTRGFNGFSYADIAAELKVTKASLHYHFPTKGDLGAALARRYTEDGAAYLEGLLATSGDPAWCMDRYAEIFRSALANDNRMCLCGIMSAELDDLPSEVRTEVDKFSEMNIGWIMRILALAKADAGQQALKDHATAIFAAIEGAQLIARGCQDIAIYDATIRAYRTTGLFP